MKDVYEMRIKSLKAMHQNIINLGDEDIYERWIICGVPDCPQEDDFEFIATDEDEFAEVWALYKRIMMPEKEESITIMNKETLINILRLVASGRIPSDLYNEYLGDEPIGFMTAYEILEYLKEE